MLRFLASMALGFQAACYVVAAARNFFVLSDVAPAAGLVLGAFWGIGAIFVLTSSVLLFKSRGQTSLRGGGWSLVVVLPTCLCIALIALIFAAVGVGEALKDPPISAEAERLLRAFFLLLAAQSAFVSLLALFATLLPYRRPPLESGRVLPVAVS